MTRGRERNTVHIVADNVDDAREQWIAAFQRDRADLGPAHAAEQAAREAARYATGRPLPELLEQLRTAWTREQNALDVLARAEPAAAALREIVAIQTERDTQLPLLREAARQTRPTLAVAEARLQQTTTIVERDADRIRDALLARWDAERPAATAAAHTVQAGTGRFGQHRARVAEAQQQLADWSAFWKPYLPGIPTDPVQTARFALRWDDRDAHADAFDRYAHHHAADLHPEHSAARAAADEAHADLRQADATYREATRHYQHQLERHGRLARDPDPAATLNQLEQELTVIQRRVDAARNTITDLEQDPTLRSSPADTVSSERARWTRDRHDARDQTERAARAITEAARIVEGRRGVGTDLTSGTGYPPPRSHQPTPSGPSLGM